MKTLKAFLILAGLLFGLSACKKDGIANPGSIIGSWNIVSDSTFAGVGINNHPVDYKGEPGDHFNFTTNGTIDTREGGVSNILSYKLVSDTSIIIGAFGITLNGTPETSHITNFTAHSLVIKTPLLLTPGGMFGRTIRLSR